MGGRPRGNRPRLDPRRLARRPGGAHPRFASVGSRAGVSRPASKRGALTTGNRTRSAAAPTVIFASDGFPRAGPSPGPSARRSSSRARRRTRIRAARLPERSEPAGGRHARSSNRDGADVTFRNAIAPVGAPASAARPGRRPDAAGVNLCEQTGSRSPESPVPRRRPSEHGDCN